MGPIILLDKSTLQSLSYNEVFILNQYFFINITPIIIVETLGDLKKQYKKNINPEKKVKELSNKVLCLDSAICLDFRALLINSLLGLDTPMDRTIPVKAGRDVISGNEKGMIFEETLEEKTLKRWKNGKFVKFEKTLSNQWRIISRNLNLEKLSSKYDFIFKYMKKTDNLNTLIKKIEVLLLKPELQNDFLKFLIIEFNIGQHKASEIFYRWEKKKDLLKDFSPYAFYCFKVNLFFYLAILNKLIGIKATNRIDLEYLYYLPFTMIFSSSDNVHKKLAPALLNENQDFITGDQFKEELLSIYKKWKELEDKQKKEWTSSKMELLKDDSIIYRLYKKHTTAEKGRKKINISKEKEKEIVEMLNKKLDSSKTSNKPIDISKMDFMIRKRTIYSNDLCPCGSGKILQECHEELLK